MKKTEEQPPKWAIRFLELTCSTTFFDELYGDLYELFYRDAERVGVERARKRFAIKAILSPRWYRLPKFIQTRPIMMYQSHLKVAARHARRHKSAAITQALGLVFGLAAIFYLGLFIKNELSFDQMHKHGAELHKILRKNPNTGARGQLTSSFHGKSLKEAFPFITVGSYGVDPVKIGEINPEFVEDFYWADSTFFELFTFTFLHGDPSTCLKAVNSLVLTESLSLKLFGTTDVMGKFVPVKVYDGDQVFPMQVTAVVEDPPQNTHIKFKALGAMQNAESLYGSLFNQWEFLWLYTYVKIPENRLREVEAGIPGMINQLFGNEPPKNFGMELQAFSKVYLYSKDISKEASFGSIRNLKIFGAVGLLILVISILNYINLATARAVIRIKEVGIRKTLGASQSNIVFQFIFEAVLFVLVSGLLAAALVLFGLPMLNNGLKIDLSIAVITTRDWFLIGGALITLGILAGIVPSLVMSRLPFLSGPSTSIKFKSSQWSLTRKFFVGTQYLVTLILLVATTVIYRQYMFMKNYDLGFNAEQLLHIPVDDRVVQGKLNLLKEKIAQLPGVEGVTVTGEDLPGEMNNTYSFNWNGSNLDGNLAINVVGVDKDYFDVLGIEFTKGKSFEYGFEVDSARSVILNREAEVIMGKSITIGEPVIVEGIPKKVVGVVENHHHVTLHSKVTPLAYFIYPPGYRVSPDNLLVKLQTKNLPTLQTELKKIWKEFSTDPLTYNFVDEAFAEAYAAERKFASLIGAFTCIAIAISLVGLFGLINFIVQLKLKEISLRRVLGAELLHLMKLLVKDFLGVFVIALLIALPIAIYLMNLWLNNYNYKVSIVNALLFLAILSCLFASLIVIYYHLQRTLRVNPSEILSGE